MVSIRLSSQAKTLKDIEQHISKHFKVLPVFRFAAADYVQKKSFIHRKIKSKFNTNLIIRSSSSN